MFHKGGDRFDRCKDWLYGRNLRKLVRQTERDQGMRSGLTTSDPERFKALERKNRELKRANEILRTASACYA